MIALMNREFNASRLEEGFHAAAAQYGERVAVRDPQSGCVTYAELEAMAGRLCDLLRSIGVAPGDRVGICCPKSIPSVVAILSILEARGTYVPVDPTAPSSRNAYIFQDCDVKAFIVDRPLLAGLQEAFGASGLEIEELPKDFGNLGVDPVVAKVTGTKPTANQTDSPAYILYTSGSTGKPKGVIHTHSSAMAFVEWCFEELEPSVEDVYSSHAPFHFDLSILDLFVSLLSGGRLVLIGEELGKQPGNLAPLIADEGITIWYSTPSILRLLVEFGKLEQRDFSKLRIVLFAGEVFPIKHLRALQSLWMGPRYYNLYGPTETNVCTFLPVPCPLPERVSEPVPIGIACSGDETRIVDADANDVEPGAKGELIVAGASVMQGYWNLPEQSARAFQLDADGRRWYRTGDIVREDTEGNLVYLGRRDRMIKRRGNRVELGEIEVALYRHESISEAAVIATTDSESEVRVRAFIAWAGPENASMIAMKKYCNANLPNYMVPDQFSFIDALPKTSTDKVDYQRLRELE